MKAKPGETIVIIEPAHEFEEYVKGDTFIVKYVDTAGIIVSECGQVISEHEFEVVAEGDAQE